MQRSLTQRFTSRPFLLAVVGALGAYFGHRYDIPNETIALYMAPLVSFILGESYKDGKAAAAGGSAESDGATTPEGAGHGTAG